MAGNQQEPPGTDEPVRITFILRDPVSDGIAVMHNGEVVWRDPTMSTWDQYMKFKMPKGVPVVLEVDEG